MKNAFLILALLGLAVAALSLSACSDTCTSTCNKHNDCAGAFHQECAAVCNVGSDQASHTSCSSQYDALQSCIAEPTPPATVCDDDSSTRCSMQHGAYDDCVRAYCAMHGDDTVCRTPI